MVNSTSAPLSERLQRSRLGPPIRWAESRVRVVSWVRHGRPAPAPPHHKRRVVAEYARRFRPTTFVETGTYRGDTVAALAPLVDRCISIELDPVLADHARRRFAEDTSVSVVQGDSAVCLGQVVAGMSEPALFWLDGHYSGGATANSGKSPIMDEVATILESDLEHVLLIDDIRLFDGTDGYPTLSELRELVMSSRPSWTFEVADDIARTHALRP